MSRIAVFFLPVLILLLVSCTTNFSSLSGNVREKELHGRGFVSMPLYSYSGDSRYWSSAKVGGSSVRLLLDSGANSTDIDKASANFIGLKQNTDYEVVSKGALGRSIRSKLGVTSLQYGSQIINPFLIVINEGAAKGSSVGRYNGQIGLDALVDSAALIDVSSEKVWMPKEDIPDGTNQYSYLGRNPQLGFEALPLYAANKYSHLILKSLYKGSPLYWIIDTGAEVSVIDRDSARKLGLNVVQTRSKMIDVSGDTSNLGYTLASNLTFGRTRIVSVPLAVANLSSVKRSFKLPSGRRVDGILGVDFLKVSKALLDPRAKLIHIGLAENREKNVKLGYLEIVN